MEAKPDFKAMSKKDKIQYIWDYYKLHILVTLCVLAAAISLIYHFATYKEDALSIIMVNAYSPYGEAAPGIEEFFAGEGLDEKTQKITVDTSISYLLSDTSYSGDYYDDQTLALQLTVGDADLFFAPWQVYDAYALSGCMVDLTTVLTEEELAQYSGILVYTTDEETNESYPCGVLLTDNPWLISNGYTEEPCNFGIAVNSDSKDLALAFFRYVLNYE